MQAFYINFGFSGTELLQLGDMRRCWNLGREESVESSESASANQDIPELLTPVLYFCF